MHKQKIIDFAKAKDADLVGFASVKCWEEGQIARDFWPHTLWEPCKTVIVLGMGMILPIVETTPSVLHMELYKTVNQKLDALAYDLTRYLISGGIPAFYYVRDGYSTMKAIEEKTMAAFGHVPAALYAGLGSIGFNNCLLTSEFGPRVRLVSVFAAEEFEEEEKKEKDLCIRCGYCAKCCPVEAIEISEDKKSAVYDKQRCLAQSIKLTKERHYPCGICTKVCPVGEDRKLYDKPGIFKKYLQEHDVLRENPEDSRYTDWEHLRRYGVTEESYRSIHKWERDK